VVRFELGATDILGATGVTGAAGRATVSAKFDGKARGVHGIRIKLGLVALAASTAVAGVALGSVGPDRHRLGAPVDYVVLYRDPHAARAAHAAITAAGGKVVTENRDIGSAVVRTTNLDFAGQVRWSGAVLGATHDRAIGRLPDERAAREAIERLSPADRAQALRRVQDGQLVPRADRVRPAPRTDVASRATAANQERPTSTSDQQTPPATAKGAERARNTGEQPAAPAPDPLASRQWDMAMIEATSTGSYATDLGDRRVRVGVIDTGVDSTHPDIAPNFDAADSRNFVTDRPTTDGPCPEPSCQDPVGVDNNGHGTHVASIIAAPINGIGISGVAPNVRIVDVRAGQSSGFFLLQPVLDALTYAGDAGLNVVNMSFYVDPWLYNCPHNPKDDTAAQNEQRTVLTAVQRAVDYARDRHVTVIAALGNESSDLDHPSQDAKSPDYPPGHAYSRTIDSSCLTVPVELPGVLSISSLGPSGRKAYYSNYSLKYNRFSAPGGDAFDTPDARVDPTAQVLGAYPEKLARASGDVDATGKPTTPFVVRDCENGVCAYYQYLQGTSMAAPHAAGVAALVISRFGTPVGDRLVLDPRLTEQALVLSADRRGCPNPAAYRYTIKEADGTRSFSQTCTEKLDTNSFYGLGLVSAGGAVLLPTLNPALAPEPNSPGPSAAPGATPATTSSPTPTATPQSRTGAPPTSPPAAPTATPNATRSPEATPTLNPPER
jgi:subtilisin family serine protease